MSKIDMLLYKQIGSIIKRERINQNISLDQLVSKIGNLKTKSSIKRYEDGKSRIDIETLTIICSALSINVNELIKEAEENVKFNTENDSLGSYIENVNYLEKNDPDLLELYNEIHSNDQLVLLFDKARKLEPQDLAQILKIIDTFNKETK